MGEPGWKTPKASEEDCWAILCPVDYCSANPGNPCMNPQGRFTGQAHKARVEKHARPVQNKEGGPGKWGRHRSDQDLITKESDFDHETFDGEGYYR